MKSTVLAHDQLSRPAAKEPETVLQHHLQSFANNDLGALMSDYTENSVLVTQEKTYAGLEEISGYFADLMSHFPKGNSSITLDKVVTSSDLVFIVWHATTPTLQLLLGTDTFVIKKGRIAQQTFAGQLKLLN